jgi:hypothetical protein
MGGSELVLRARMLARLRSVASMQLLPIDNRPCLLPCPNLMTSVPSNSWVLGSKSSPLDSRAAEVYSQMRAPMVGLLYASGPSSALKVTPDVALPLWARQYAE